MASIREYHEVYKQHSVSINDDKVAQYKLNEIWKNIPLDDSPMNHSGNFFNHLRPNIPRMVMDFIELIVKNDKSKYDQALKEFCYLHCMSIENFKQFFYACQSKKYDFLHQHHLNLTLAYLQSLSNLHYEYLEKITMRDFLTYHQNFTINYSFLQSIWDNIPYKDKDPFKSFYKNLLEKLKSSQELPSMIMKFIIMIMKFIKTINSNVEDTTISDQVISEFCYLHCMSNLEFVDFFKYCDDKRKNNKDEISTNISSTYSETLKYTLEYYLSTERTIDELNMIKVLIIREFRNYHDFVNNLFQYVKSDYPDVHRQQFFTDGLKKLRKIEPFFNMGVFNSGQTNEEIIRSYLEIMSISFKSKQVIDGVETEKNIFPIRDTKELRTTFLRSSFLVGTIELMYDILKFDKVLINYEDIEDLTYHHLSRLIEFYKIIHEFMQKFITFTDTFITISKEYDIPMDQLHGNNVKKIFNEALILTESFLNMYCSSGIFMEICCILEI